MIAIKTQMPEKGANFTAINSKHDNCICAACHDTSRVMKIRLPKKLFYDSKNLSTKYSEYWLCDQCKRNLQDALENTAVES